VEGKRAHQRQLVAEGGSVLYSASNYGIRGTSIASAGYRYAVCVVSKKRSRLDVYEADGGGCVFGLEADASRGLASLYGDAPLVSSMEGMDFLAKRDALIKSFGSQKKKRMEATRKANIVNVDAVAGAAEVSINAATSSSIAAKGKATVSAQGGEAVLQQSGDSVGDSSAQEVPPTSSAAAAEDEARRRLLPPFNKFATSPHDAYPLEGILPPPIAASLRTNLSPLLKALRSLGKKVPEGGTLPSPLDSPMVTGFLPTAALDSKFSRSCLASVFSGYALGTLDKEAASRRILCCLYASILTALLSISSRAFLLKRRTDTRSSGVEAMDRGADSSFADTAGGGGGGDTQGDYTVVGAPALNDCPWEVLQFSLIKFSQAQESPRPGFESHRYVKSEESSKRLLYHTAILALTARDFSLDAGLLADDLKLTPMELVKIFKEMGCKSRKLKKGEGGEDDEGGTEGEADGGGEDTRAGLHGLSSTSYIVTLAGPPQFSAPSRGGKSRR